MINMDDQPKDYEMIDNIVPNRRRRKWWKLWWYIPHWKCYGFRFKWVRDVYSKIKAR